MNKQLMSSNITTMSSLEIAQLVISRHDNVRRTIERLSGKGIIQLPPTEVLENINRLGLKVKSYCYMFAGERGKRDSIIVVAQLCPEFAEEFLKVWDKKLKVNGNSTGLLTPCRENIEYMSSRGVAELTGKRHDNVLRDIQSTTSDLSPLSASTTYIDSKGEQRREWLLTKRDTLMLVMGYNISPARKLEFKNHIEEHFKPMISNDKLQEPIGGMDSQKLLEMVNQARKECGEMTIRNNVFIERVKDELDGETYKNFVGRKNGADISIIYMTHKQALRVAARESKAVRRSLIDKLEELSGGQNQQHKIPQTYSEALSLAAEQAKVIEMQRGEIESAAPKVAFVDSYVDTKGLMGFRQVAKLLEVKEDALRSFLVKNKYMYKLSGGWAFNHYFTSNGYGTVKTFTTDDGTARTTIKFTPRGVEMLARRVTK